jgi:hypothetical protein
MQLHAEVFHPAGCTGMCSSETMPAWTYRQSSLPASHQSPPSCPHLGHS